MLRFQWCFNKILYQIHVYGWGAGTYNQHLISMVDVVNIDISPIGGDAFKNILNQRRRYSMLKDVAMCVVMYSTQYSCIDV